MARLSQCLCVAIMFSIFCMVYYSESDSLSYKVQSLHTFDATRNDFSRKFAAATHSRSLFIRLFGKLQTDCAANDEDVVGDEDVGGDQDVVGDEDVGGDQDVVGDISYAGDLEASEYPPVSQTHVQDAATEDWADGDCEDVHVNNLVPPMEERLIRPLDRTHVEEIATGLRKDPQQHTILVGILVEGMRGELAIPGKTKVEVIGGNHTREAFQLVNSEGIVRTTLKVKIYTGLTNNRALQIGFHHNFIGSKSKDMCFIDIVRVIRRKLNGLNRKEKRTQKGELATIFVFESVTKMNRNYTIHLNVASFPEVSYKLVEEMERRWSERTVPGIPRTPMRQTHVSGLLSLVESDRKEVLNTFLSEGFQPYKKKMIELKNALKVNNEETAVSEENAVEMETEAMSGDEIGSEKELKSPDRFKKPTAVRVRPVKRKVEQHIFEKGDSVEALWKDTKPNLTGWFAATVLQTNGPEVKVQFYDGVKATLPAKYVRYISGSC